MDADRLAELVDAHAAALELYAARWTAAPEDCVQEAFVELAGQAVEPKHVAAWLFRVVRNRALNVARTDRRRRERERIVARLRPVEDARTWDAALDVASLTSALDHLPRESHEIIVLRIWSELSFEEIATVLDCSISTAHRRYRRALEELRNLFEERSCPSEGDKTKNRLPGP